MKVRLRAEQAITLVWIVSGSALSVAVLRNATDSGRWVIGVAAIIAVTAAASSLALQVSDKSASAGLLLGLSAVMPTGFVWPPNLLVLLLGARMAVGAIRARSLAARLPT